MWPKQFDYARASSIDEAIQMLGDDMSAKALAGGHSLLPAMKLRLAEASKLVDIGRLAELKGIKADGSLTIGAATTHAEIAASADVQKMCAALAQAASHVGDPQVRNFGTLGGNVAHADPASDPPTVLVACDATVHIKGASGTRSVPAADFFVDLFTTGLQPGEIITAVEIPDHSKKQTAYAKLSHPASRYAVVGVAVALDMNGVNCESASVSIGGAVASARRCPGAEAALAGTKLDDDALATAADAIQSDIDGEVMGDINFPDDYRKAMAGVYLKRAVKAAVG